MMRDIAIYFINDGKDNTAYLCQGRLFDYLRGKGYRISKSTGHTSYRRIETPDKEIITFRREILSCSEEEYVQLLRLGRASISKRVESNLWSVYKVPDVEETWGVDRRKNQTEAEAKFYQEKRGQIAEVRQLDTTIIDSLSLPFRVYIQRDQKGKLFCRLNLHAELDGLTSQGKLCFPDKTWEGVAEGDAIVESCTELPTYAFIRGSMVKYTIPSMDVFVPWAVKNLGYNEIVFFVTDSPHGDYIGIKDKNTNEYHRIVCIDGQLFTKAFYPIVDDINISHVIYKEVYKIVFESIFGDNGVSLSDFVDCNKHIVELREQTKSTWIDVSGDYPEEFVELIRRALSYGLISCHKNENYSVFVFNFNVDKILNLYCFTAEEIETLVQICDKYNNDACEKLTVE